MACTIPKIGGFYKWFEAKFSDLCKAHDDVYVNRSSSKLQADIALAKGMLKRGHPFIAISAFVFCSTVGWWYWLKD